MKRLLGVLASAVVLLSGCSFALFAHDPPTKEEILQAIRQHLPKDGKQIKPTAGMNRDEVLMVDLNQDRSLEGIAFYQKQGKVHLLIVEKIANDEWKTVDISEKGGELRRVDVVDLTGDKKPEVAFSVVDHSKTQTVEPEGVQIPYEKVVVYDLSGENPNKRLEKWASEGFAAMDFDGDGKGELVLYDRQYTEEELKMELYQFENNQFRLADQKSEIIARTATTNFEAGKLNRKTNGIIMNLYHYSGAGFQIFLVEKGKFKELSPTGMVPEYSVFSGRSEDVNHDGFFEIPISESGLIEWYQVKENNQLENVHETYENFTYGFRVHIPEEWRGKLMNVSGMYPGNEEYYVFLKDKEAEGPDLESMLTIVIAESEFSASESQFKEAQMPYFYAESPSKKKKILVAVNGKSGFTVEQVKKWIEWVE